MSDFDRDNEGDSGQSAAPSGRLGRRTFVRAAAGAGLGAGIPPAAEGAPGQGIREKVYREALATPVAARYQVVVAGGGPSGVIAALAAARTGASTLLVERCAFLGGNGTAGLMTCYNGFRHQRPPEALQTVKGIPAEYIAELVRLGGVAEYDTYYQPVKHDVTKGDIPYTVPFDAEVAKVAALNLVRKEGVTLRLHSWIAGPMLDGGRVTGVVVESKSGRQAIEADVVIDCTGDGDIAARAGAAFMGPVDWGAGDRMNMTLMYRLGGVPPGIEGAFEGIRTKDRVTRWGPGFKGDGLNVEDLTRAEVEVRLALWDRVCEMRKKPGLESLYLMETAATIGVRETRRILGEYVLTEKEAIEGKRFPDVVAISSNPFPDYRGNRRYLEHEGFDIPYRCLVPRKVEGLVLSGRCISCEQAPFQSARSMAPAMAVGHASGCAAAMAALGGIPPRKLDVKALQKKLQSQNAELRL